jgi:anti-sigma B factor antagonist
MPSDAENLRRPPVSAVETIEGAVVVRLAGELDLYNSDEVRETLAAVAQQPPDRLVIELSEVSFLDSTMLGVLVEARQKLAGRPIALAGAGEPIRRAVEVAGLAGHLPLYDSVADALAATT